MKAIIEIDMDNSAFDNNNGYELARILRDIADSLSYEYIEGTSKRLLDINGNRTGQMIIID